MAAVGAFVAAYGGYIAAAAAAVSAASSIAQANIQKSNAETTAKAATYNQQVMENKAEVARQVGSANEDAQRRKGDIALGSLRAGLSESGIGLQGTGGDIYKQSAQNAELDALNIRYGGTLQAQGYQQNAAVAGYDAQTAGLQASNAMSAGYLNAGASALNSASSYYGRTAYNRYPSSGGY